MKMSQAMRLLGYGALPGGSVMIEAQEFKELAEIGPETKSVVPKAKTTPSGHSERSLAILEPEHKEDLQP